MASGSNLKKKSPAKRASPKAGSKASKKPAGRPANPRARAYLAMGLGFGALISLLALFEANGVLLGWLAWLLKGIFGIGFFVVPLALGYSVWLVLAKVEGQKRRLISALAVPFIVGAIGQSFAGQPFSDIKTLFANGLELKSGGLLSGGFALLLESAISRIGADILLLLAGLTVLFSALNITPAMIFDLIGRAGEEDGGDDFNDDEEDYGEGFTETYADEPASAADFSFPVEKRAKNIDIALDADGMPVASRQAAQRARQFRIEPAVDQGLMDLDDVIISAPEAPPGPLPGEPPQPEPFAQRPRRVSPRKEAPVIKKEIEPLPFMGEAVDLDQKPGYFYPPVTLLEPDENDGPSPEAAEEVRRNSQRLIETLKSFGVDAKIIAVTRGPSVTRYEVQTGRGTKYSKVTSLSDDIALALAAQSARIAPIPDKVAIGIEVPNRVINMVHIRDIIESAGFQKAKSRVSFAMGRDISGEPVVGDVAKLPHLLVAGTTGSGKSVCINSIIISILYKAGPDEVKFIMIDPKMIELDKYNGIPHLLIPVVTDPKKAAGALQWALGEMMKRYKKMKEAGVRNLADYNAWLKNKQEQGELTEEKSLAQIVIVIDELADLMLVAAGEVEEAICRLAQMARAAGMHLIIATQRPSANIITGIMKANIPSRISFAVASQLESRIILDTMGAEKLIGRGDMLFNPIGSTKPTRIQGCLITSKEVSAVVDYIKANHEAQYSQDIIAEVERAAEREIGQKKGSAGDDETDVMFDEAVQVIMDTGQASASMLQRRLKLGYARASRLIDQMEERGIIGPFEGSKARQIMISKTDWLEMVSRREL